MKAQIRQLDDHVLAALRARAKAQGLSLEQSLRDLLTARAMHSAINLPSCAPRCPAAAADQLSGTRQKGSRRKRR